MENYSLQGFAVMVLNNFLKKHQNCELNVSLSNTNVLLSGQSSYSYCALRLIAKYYGTCSNNRSVLFNSHCVP